MFATVSALLAAAPGFAHGPLAAKRAEAELVYAQIQRLDVSLGQANERLNLANIQLAVVRSELALNRRKLRVANHNLRRSRTALAERLVTLYTTRQTSSLEVILGASSLDGLLNRVDAANRVSSLDGQVVREVKAFSGEVTRRGRALVRARVAAQRLIAERAAQERAIARQLDQRRSLLSAIQGEIARLEAEQRARELQAAQAARAAMIEAQAAARLSFASSAVGASGATPEGASVVPASGYSGVVGVAMSYLGTPYSWGGASPGGFDCSGLVTYAYGTRGVSLPHSSYALWNVGVSVPRDQLEPGDLVFFNGLGHMGIYVGGDQFVHAPHTGDVVKVSSISGSYSSSYVGARRVLR